MGRTSFTTSVEQIQALREGVFLRWTDIARILGVSTITQSCRRQELGLSVGHGSNFSQISDAALDNLVRQILTSAPQSGIGLIRGSLQSRGWRTSDYGSFAKIRPSHVCPETNKANNPQNIQCPQSQFTFCSTYQF